MLIGHGGRGTVKEGRGQCTEGGTQSGEGGTQREKAGTAREERSARPRAVGREGEDTPRGDRGRGGIDGGRDDEQRER